ncbi:MAG: tetratricopeptide repeat protein [Planctomycetota bacterium]
MTILGGGRLWRLSALALVLFCGCGLAVLPPVDPYLAYLDRMNGQDYAGAAAGLETRLQAAPDDWEAQYYLGICYEKMGRRYRAIACYEKAAARADNYRPFFRLGVLYIEMGSADKALPMLRRVRQFDPTFLYGRFYLAVAAFFNNRIEEASENFNYILAKEENNPGSLAGIGVVKYHQGNPFQAVEFLLRSIRYAPDWAWGHFQLGQIYMRLGQSAEARREFELALQHDPANADAAYNLGLILEGAGRQAEADKLFRLLLDRPDTEGALVPIKAGILIKQGDYLGARDLLVANLNTAPQPFEVYKRLGYVYALLGDRAKGMACYAEALKYTPDDIPVRYNYAVLLKAAGDEAGAERQFDEILAINPLAAEGYFLQGIILGRRGDLARAEELIKTAVALDRFDRTGREVLLNILISNDKLSEAAAVAEEIVALHPEDRGIRGLLAEVCVRLGRYRQAEDLLSALIRWEAPVMDDVEHMKLLYTVYQATGRRHEADGLRERIRALGIDPLERPVLMY